MTEVPGLSRSSSTMNCTRLPLVVALSALSAACGGGSSAPDASAPESGTETMVFIEHGGAVFATAGCGDCHGMEDGSEGPTVAGVPTFDTFSARFGLSSDTRGPALEWLASGALHDRSRDGEQAFEGFEQFLLTARLYERLIAGDGHDAVFARMELASPMPEWSAVLSDRDIESLLAYLIWVNVE